VREPDRDLGAVADIGVVIGELPGLLGDRLGDLLAPVADVDAVEAGEGVEEPLAVAIDDVAALGTRHDPVRRLAAGVLAEMGRGVEEVLAVPAVENVVGQHLSSFPGSGDASGFARAPS
jgi:hypothetical protein